MQFVISKAVLSYPNLKEARAVTAGDDPKYGAALLLTEDSVIVELVEDEDGYRTGERKMHTIKSLKKALISVAQGRFGKKTNTVLSANNGRGFPLKMNDSEKYPKEVVAFFNASGKRRPKLVDHAREEVATDDIEEIFIYGSLVNAQVNFYAYDNVGKGVSAGLNSLQFAGASGINLGGGGVPVAEAFEEIALETSPMDDFEEDDDFDLDNPER